MAPEKERDNSQDDRRERRDKVFDESYDRSRERVEKLERPGEWPRPPKDEKNREDR